MELPRPISFPLPTPDLPPSVSVDLPPQSQHPDDQFANTVLRNLSSLTDKKRMVITCIATVALVSVVLLGIFVVAVHSTQRSLVEQVQRHDTSLRSLQNKTAELAERRTISPPPLDVPKRSVPNAKRFPTEDPGDRDIVAGRGESWRLKAFELSSLLIEWPDVPFDHVSNYDLCCRLQNETLICNSLETRLERSGKGTRLVLQPSSTLKTTCTIRFGGK
jgi:hypothetical protein